MASRVSRGLSAAAAGLIFDNKLMIVGGILVGASGTILTVLMCQAMNRSLLNVLIGGFSATGGVGQSDDGKVAKVVNFMDASIDAQNQANGPRSLGTYHGGG